MSVQLVLEHLRFFRSVSCSWRLGFPCWLTQVGCSTPAVVVSHGVGGCLVTGGLFPPCFFFVPAQLPLRGSAPLPSGLACLSPVCWSTLKFGWRGLAATFSSVPVRCFPCCRYVGIFGLLLLRFVGVVGALLPVSGCSC